LQAEEAEDRKIDAALIDLSGEDLDDIETIEEPNDNVLEMLRARKAEVLSQLNSVDTPNWLQIEACLEGQMPTVKEMEASVKHADGACHMSQTCTALSVHAIVACNVRAYICRHKHAHACIASYCYP
jgi:hypothetical protein